MLKRKKINKQIKLNKRDSSGCNIMLLLHITRRPWWNATDVWAYMAQSCLLLQNSISTMACTERELQINKKRVLSAKQRFTSRLDVRHKKENGISEKNPFTVFAITTSQMQTTNRKIPQGYVVWFILKWISCCLVEAQKIFSGQGLLNQGEKDWVVWCIWGNIILNLFTQWFRELSS